MTRMTARRRKAAIALILFAAQALGAGLRLLPAPQGAARQRRLGALGRRTADAGDRARPDDQSAPADSRRGDRGARADRAREIRSRLAALTAEGEAILLIDKNIGALMRLSIRHVMLEKGRVAWSGTGLEFDAEPDVQDHYLHV